MPGFMLIGPKLWALEGYSTKLSISIYIHSHSHTYLRLQIGDLRSIKLLIFNNKRTHSK